MTSKSRASQNDLFPLKKNVFLTKRVPVPVCTAHGTVRLIQVWWPENSPQSQHTGAQAGMKLFQLLLQIFCFPAAPDVRPILKKTKKNTCTSEGVSNTHTQVLAHSPAAKHTPSADWHTFTNVLDCHGAPWELDQRYLIAKFQKAWVVYRAPGWVNSFLLFRILPHFILKNSANLRSLLISISLAIFLIRIS